MYYETIIFKNKILDRSFGRKKEELTTGWRILHNNKLNAILIRHQLLSESCKSIDGRNT